MHRLPLALAASLAAVLLAAPVAAADQQTATSGTVHATLSYTPVNDFGANGIRITVTRAGATAYDAPVDPRGCRDDGICRPLSLQDDGTSLALTDLDGDGDPEVLVNLYTGGAHCCQVSRFLRWDGAKYVPVDHDWADPGYRVEDLDTDGAPELVSADPRFAYRYGSYASSAFPIQIWSLKGGRLTDTTRSHRSAIRADAARQWRAVRGAARHYPRGVVAAWAADRYRLGVRARTLRTLRRMAARHQLPREGPGLGPRSQRTFVSRLDRDLRRLGYA
jgi:hypothetical protein